MACAGSPRVLILDHRTGDGLQSGSRSARDLGEDKGDNMYTRTLAASVFAVGFAHTAMAVGAEAPVPRPVAGPRPPHLHPV